MSIGLIKPSVLFLPVLMVLNFLSAFGSSQGGDGPGRDSISVLVFTRNGEGFVHDNIDASIEMFEEMSQEFGFVLTVSDNSKVFNKKLDKFNVIVFSNTNNEVFDTEEERLSFMRYIQAGGGFVGIHSAVGTERQWEWFRRMVGGVFVRHPPYQKLEQIVIDTANASMSAVPVRWEIEDECYYLADINPDIHVLMVHDLSIVEDKEEKPDVFGAVYPSAWCHQYDEGREWVTTLGHDKKIYSDSVFQGFIMGGIRWAVGDNRPLDYSKAYAENPRERLRY